MDHIRLPANRDNQLFHEYIKNNSMRLLSAGLLSFFATVMLGATLLLSLPGDFAERAIWLSVFIPIIWSGFMFYSYWDSRAGRAGLVLFSIIIFGGLAVFLLPVPV